MSLLRSFFTLYGAPGRLYYDSYEFFKCSPQANLRVWRKLAVTFFPNQIQIGNSLGWFLTLWTTHSCKNQLVANFFPDIVHNSLTITEGSRNVYTSNYKITGANALNKVSYGCRMITDAGKTVESNSAAVYIVGKY